MKLHRVFLIALFSPHALSFKLNLRASVNQSIAADLEKPISLADAIQACSNDPDVKMFLTTGMHSNYLPCGDGFKMLSMSCQDALRALKVPQVPCLTFLCDTSVPPTYGSVGDCPAELPSKSSCQPTCQSGYGPNGPSTCDESGKLKAAVCQPLPCKYVAPEHGNVGKCPSVLASGSSCVPTCNEGYTLVGSSSCLLGNLTVATCTLKTCDTVAPQNGILGNCPMTLTAGSSCNPFCNDGYTPSGISKCDTSGVFKVATCKPDPCDVSAPENGALGNCPFHLPDGASCQPSCNEGYKLQGTTSCRTGHLTAATCVVKTCDVLPPDHGVLGSCNKSITAGSTCEPKCNEGYSVVGTSSCNMSGAFHAAICQPNACDASASPLNGVVGNCSHDLPHGHSCLPECNQGYTLSSPNVCEFGKLVPAAVCNANVCRTAVAPVHGSVGNCPEVLPAYGSCQPSCQQGFTVSGPSTCDGLGQLQAATCIPESCDASVPPSYGSAGNCSAGLSHGASCVPNCNMGYVLSAPTTCNFGVLAAGKCKALSCNASIPPENGEVGNCGDKLSNGAFCTPKCNAGYTLSGACVCRLGVLSAAVCHPSPCLVSQAPMNGGVGNCSSVLQHGETCLPSCSEGLVVTGVTECSLGVLKTVATCEGGPTTTFTTTTFTTTTETTTITSYPTTTSSTETTITITTTTSTTTTTTVTTTTEQRPWVLLAKSINGTSKEIDLSKSASTIEKGSGRIMMTWSTKAMPLDPDYSGAYEKAVEFSVPGHIRASESSKSGNKCHEGEFFTLVDVQCTRGKCNLPPKMYTGTGFNRICFDSAYGLVSPQATRNKQCDWSMDTQDFASLYLGHPLCHGVKNSLGETATDDQMLAIAIWTRG